MQLSMQWELEETNLFEGNEFWIFNSVHSVYSHYMHRGPVAQNFNTIDGNFAINGNYHGNLDFDWLLSPVTNWAQ